MKAIRYQGIYTNGVSTAYGSDIVNIFGTSNTNIYSSYISVNDNVIEQNNTQNGFIIVALNPDLTVRRNRFFPIKTISESNNFVTFINSIVNTTSDILIAVAGVGNLERDDETILNNFFNNKGSVLWGKRELFKDQDDNGNVLKDNIPYCFLMSTKLGIVYENYGNYQIDDKHDNAILNIPYHGFDSLGMNGYGPNLINIDEYQDSSVSATTDSFPIVTPDPSQNIRVKIIGRIENLDQYPNNKSYVHIRENGSIIETYTIDSNVWQNIDDFISINQSNNYDVFIEKDSDVILNISTLVVTKAGFSTITTDVKFKLNKDNNNVSCFDINETFNNIQIENESEYDIAYQNNVVPFNPNQTTFLYRSQKDSLNVLGTVTSDFIQIDPRIDYAFCTWFKGLSNSDQIDITVYFYDSSQNLINAEYFDSNFSNTININSFNIDNNEYGYTQSFILSKNATRYDLNRFEQIETEPMDNDDYGLEQLTRTVPKLNDSIEYIKLEISATNVDMIMPLISEVKFGFKNDGTVLGPVIENTNV